MVEGCAEGRGTDERERVDLLDPPVHVAWEPMEGSQTAFLNCPFFECLYHGSRGPGKTDALLMSFAMFAGRGFGRAWRGVLFRQTYPQLADVIAKSQKFRSIFPGIRFNQAKNFWIWPDGETLYFRHISGLKDYWLYHGHEYPWIGWEELVTWPNDECYLAMMTCCRSSHPNVPRMIRATTNPYGAGHHWVRRRFGLYGDWRKRRIVKTEEGSSICSVHGHVDENVHLLRSDPFYKRRLKEACPSEALSKAWIDGSWDITVGGMFSDIWNSAHHVVVVNVRDIPDSWRVDRSFDWGSSAPFSVGWWAESDGTDFVDANGERKRTVRGDLFRIAEWYGQEGKGKNKGCRMLAKDIARGIRERERAMGLEGRVRPGPADSAIFSEEDGRSIAGEMEKPVRTSEGRVLRGISWVRSDKRPGSRHIGWERMRRMLADALPVENGARERPGLFVNKNCLDFVRTIPSLMRDERDMDDIDRNSEDHIADETRYRISAQRQIVAGRVIGSY